ALALRYTPSGQLDTTFNVQNSLAGKSLAGVGGPAVDLLWGQGSVYDAEHAATNYGGTTLTVQRHGGAVAADVFGFDSPAQVVNGHLMAFGQDFGTVTNSGGTVTIHFSANATQD